MKITTIGIDLAKNVFQVHGVDERGKAVLKKQLKRDQMAVFFAKTAGVPDWYGSLRQFAPLGQKTPGFRTYGAIDGPTVRQALCENEQERCRRCRGDL
jgi:hypothetical protein